MTYFKDSNSSNLPITMITVIVEIYEGPKIIRRMLIAVSLEERYRRYHYAVYK